MERDKNENCKISKKKRKKERKKETEQKKEKQKKIKCIGEKTKEKI